MSEQNFVGELMNLKVSDGDEDGESAGTKEERPDIYPSAVEVIIREGRGSGSLLQRHLGIGYGRAAKLIDFMAEDGIVGHYNGSKAREVLMTLDEWNASQGIESSDEDEEVGTTPPTAEQEEDYEYEEVDEAAEDEGEYEYVEEEEEYEDWDE